MHTSTLSILIPITHPLPQVPPRSEVAAAAELLKQLGVGPILRVPDDPVVDLPSQPVVPDPTLAYGGVLGQWPGEQRETSSTDSCLPSHTLLPTI